MQAARSNIYIYIYIYIYYINYMFENNPTGGGHAAHEEAAPGYDKCHKARKREHGLRVFPFHLGSEEEEVNVHGERP